MQFEGVERHFEDVFMEKIWVTIDFQCLLAILPCSSSAKLKKQHLDTELVLADY